MVDLEGATWWSSSSDFVRLFLSKDTCHSISLSAQKEFMMRKTWQVYIFHSDSSAFVTYIIYWYTNCILYNAHIYNYYHYHYCATACFTSPSWCLNFPVVLQLQPNEKCDFMISTTYSACCEHMFLNCENMEFTWTCISTWEIKVTSLVSQMQVNKYCIASAVSL